ncbi:hypothetical protein [Planktosalinus lacus]|uniref:DUF4179 domain-containing protein n=1 Tax=Planktosalinus lacus TaxID=1526573 RepID=A0A8J2Y8H7_9FLAO|nr:hypothetical protein [Planktosalinus lacus]GGD93248.1 hypothetical protein GCM10011312_16230 [Planktosalinus lacus]
MKDQQFDANLKALFNREQLPMKEPADGHKLRFMEKLNDHQKNKKPSINYLHFAKPLAIAASFLILFTFIFPFFNTSNQEADLASISPEMAQTQAFFTSTINRELNLLKNSHSPETSILIEDALNQMTVLENEYDKLKVELVKSGNDERIIYAMITNFQNRIDLLKQVLEQIEHIKNLNTENHETTV